MPHGRSISASPISTSRTTTGRRRARRNRISATSCASDFRRLSRRADHLHQGRLRHVARPLWRMGSRKYLLASLDQSLKRMGLDYVDIFYSHRLDPETPLEETMGALDHAVRQGKALYVGISTYNSRRTSEAAAILRELGTPCLIHQPSYSMIDRWVEDDQLLDTLGAGRRRRDRFLPARARPVDRPIFRRRSRRARARSRPNDFSDRRCSRQRTLSADAKARRHRQAARPDAGADGAGLGVERQARDARRSSARAAPSRSTDSVKALDNLSFAADELKEIDRYAVEGGVNLWRQSGRAQRLMRPVTVAITLR